MKIMQLRKWLAASFLLTGIAYAAVGWDIPVDGGMRHLAVDAPSGLNNPPLVIFMHGAQGNADAAANDVKWDVIAEREKIVVAYPQSNGSFWDLGGYADINFILAIIDTMAKKYNINRNRVYATGWSMGGMLSYYLACKVPDKIAAIGPSSGYPMYGESDCKIDRPMPVYHIHGVYDDFVKYSELHGFLNTKVSQYGCPAKPDSTYKDNVLTEHWGPCNLNGRTAEINLVSAYKPHYYGWEESQVMWDFMKNYTISGNDNPPVPILGATFYQFNNFGGLNAKLVEGSYTLSQLQSASIPDNAINSMKVDAGLTVELFDNDNFQVQLGSFDSDLPDFGAKGFSNKVTSLRIVKTSSLSSSNEMLSSSVAASSSAGTVAMQSRDVFSGSHWSIHNRTLTWNTTQTMQGTIAVFDILGNVRNVLYTGSIAPGSHTFHVGNLENGIYFVRVSSGARSFAHKFRVVSP